MKTLGFAFTSLAILVSIKTTTPITEEDECQPGPDWARKAADPLADFAVLLYGNILRKSSTDQQSQRQSTVQEFENVVIAPVSIAMVLAVLHHGAAHDTRSQIRYMIAKRGTSEADTDCTYQSLKSELGAAHVNKAQLKLVPAFYYQQSINLKEQFLTSVRSQFDIQLEKCDFRSGADQCRRTINDWVSSNTAQKIPNLLPEGSIDQNTISVIASAVYFNASWEETFTNDQIETRSFYKRGQTDLKQEVPFLTNDGDYLYFQAHDVYVVGIPYKGSQFYMFIVLPKKRDGLAEFENSLTGTELNTLFNRTRLKEVELKIPKFKVKMSTDLKPILQTLGLRNMFSAQANFSRMTDGQLTVNSAMHEAFIHVNENGTEAAAATGMAMRPFGARPIPIPFIADHPFFYAIVHKPTWAMIFAGRVIQVD